MNSDFLLSNDNISNYKNEEKYFAASNSSEGFYSYYKDVFSHDKGGIDVLYVVIGGPGTGKNRFMRNVADMAEKKGFEVKYYYCSSDPNSLDGVILDLGEHRKIGVIDGTAPHTYASQLPGAVERTVDLGAFWNESELSKYKKTLERLNGQKSSAFKSAYSYLSAYASVMENVERISRRVLLVDKMKKNAQRYIKAIPSGSGYRVRPALVSSVGMNGAVRFDTFERRAKNLYILSDYCDTAHIMAGELLRLVREKEQAVTVAYDPVLPNRVEGFFVENTKTAFIIGDYGRCIKADDGRTVKNINMHRFVDCNKYATLKRDMLTANRHAHSLMDSALKCFADVSRSHFAIEEIYIGNMDFTSKEKFASDFCDKLFC